MGSAVPTQGHSEPYDLIKGQHSDSVGKGPWRWVRAQGGEGQTDSPHRQSLGEECIERRGKGKEKRKKKRKAERGEEVEEGGRDRLTSSEEQQKESAEMGRSCLLKETFAPAYK